MKDIDEVNPEALTFEEIRSYYEKLLSDVRDQKEESKRLRSDFERMSNWAVQENIEQAEELIEEAERLEERLQTIIQNIPEEPDAARDQKMQNLKQIIAEFDDGGSL